MPASAFSPTTAPKPHHPAMPLTAWQRERMEPNFADVAAPTHPLAILAWTFCGLVAFAALLIAGALSA